MLKIRLQRVGRKHEPTYRVVVCDSKRGPKSGDNIEILGAYDARDKNETKVNEERVKYWISNGAQVSDTVHNLLINLGIIKGKKINVLPKKTVEVKESVDNAQDGTEVSEKVEETPVEESKPEVKAEEVAEETPKEETAEEISAEESKEESDK